MALLFAVVTLSGICIVGGQQALNGMAASYYPTALRSTGAGWALGIGRLGSVIGPVLGRVRGAVRLLRCDDLGNEPGRLEVRLCPTHPGGFGA